jgi:hypothetical protein
MLRSQKRSGPDWDGRPIGRRYDHAELQRTNVCPEPERLASKMHHGGGMSAAPFVELTTLAIDSVEFVSLEKVRALRSANSVSQPGL